MNIKTLTLVCLVMAFASGCTNMNRTQQGFLSGAAVGALAGAGLAAAASGSGTTGALIGGGAGAALGAAYGAGWVDPSSF